MLETKSLPSLDKEGLGEQKEVAEEESPKWNPRRLQGW